MRYEDILRWWKEEKKDTKEDIYTLLDNFKILFAYHSGKIEGFIEFLKEQMVKTWEKKKRGPVNLGMFL